LVKLEIIFIEITIYLEIIEVESSIRKDIHLINLNHLANLNNSVIVDFLKLNDS